MKRFNPENISEKSIYLVFWIVIFVMPVFLSTGENQVDWNRVVHETTRILPFFFIFLIHNFILYKLLKLKKYTVYLALTFLTILVFCYIASFDKLFFDYFHIPRQPDHNDRHDTMRILNDGFDFFIISSLVIALNNTVKSSISWLRSKHDYEQLQKENIRNQLTMLQHQISPHFFMNTLNNIHALIDYDREIAKNSVVKLAKMMRVLLYENENYTLEKEIGFLKDYIDLMKIRVGQNVDIRFEYPGNLPQVKMPPLLFISFAENAFKHGILPDGPSFIHIRFSVTDEILSVMIHNSRFPSAKINKDEEKIGMSNSQKRLDLIYHNTYTYQITEDESSYKVDLKIPLNLQV